MNNIDILEIAKFANKLADASDSIIKKYYRSETSYQIKEDRSLVTKADLEIEDIITKMIKDQFPNHGIIGEENGTYNIESKYKWIIDPIDGTNSFIIGRPIFATLIAFAIDNKPVYGLIDQPITNDRWQSTDENNIDEKQKITKLSDAIIATTGPNYFTKKEEEIFKFIEQDCNKSVFGGDCYNYALLSDNKVDIVIESGLKNYDFAALIPVIKNKGGIVTNWEGKEITIDNSPTQILACTNEKLHQITLNKIKNYGK